MSASHSRMSTSISPETRKRQLDAQSIWTSNARAQQQQQHFTDSDEDLYNATGSRTTEKAPEEQLLPLQRWSSLSFGSVHSGRTSVVRENWVCSHCSYNNVDGNRSRCALCGKQDGEYAEKEKRKWKKHPSPSFPVRSVSDDAIAEDPIVESMESQPLDEERPLPKKAPPLPITPPERQSPRGETKLASRSLYPRRESPGVLPSELTSSTGSSPKRPSRQSQQIDVDDQPAIPLSRHSSLQQPQQPPSADDDASIPTYPPFGKEEDAVSTAPSLHSMAANSEATAKVSNKKKKSKKKKALERKRSSGGLASQSMSMKKSGSNTGSTQVGAFAMPPERMAKVDELHQQQQQQRQRPSQEKNVASTSTSDDVPMVAALPLPSVREQQEDEEVVSRSSSLQNDVLSSPRQKRRKLLWLWILIAVSLLIAVGIILGIVLGMDRGGGTSSSNNTDKSTNSVTTQPTTGDVGATPTEAPITAMPTAGTNVQPTPSPVEPPIGSVSFLAGIASDLQVGEYLDTSGRLVVTAAEDSTHLFRLFPANAFEPVDIDLPANVHGPVAFSRPDRSVYVTSGSVVLEFEEDENDGVYIENGLVDFEEAFSQEYIDNIQQLEITSISSAVGDNQVKYLVVGMVVRTRDGRQDTSVAASFDRIQGAVQGWRTPRLIQTIENSDTVFAILSDNANILLTATTETVQIYERAGPASMVLAAHQPSIPPQTFESITLSGNGETIVTASLDEQSNPSAYYRFDSRSQEWLGRSLLDAPGTTVAVSSDGNLVAVGNPQESTATVAFIRENGNPVVVDTLQGTNSDAMFGASLSITTLTNNNSVQLISVGAPPRSENGNTAMPFAGSISVYRYS